MYIMSVFFPINLSVVHYVSIPTSILEPIVLLSISIIFALLLITIKIYKYSKVVFFCIGWFFITLLPVSNIIPIGTWMAERYLYLPSFGFCLFIAVVIHKMYNSKIKQFSEKSIKIIALSVLIFILTFYSVSTIFRNSEWKDDLTLWSETVKTSPDSAKAHNNLGHAYFENKSYDQAIAEYKEALKLYPDYDEAHDNLGIVYAKKGSYEKAIIEFKEAIRINPYNAMAHNNLGIAYFNTGNYDLAKQEFLRAIDLDPYNENIQSNFRKVMSKLNP